MANPTPRPTAPKRKSSRPGRWLLAGALALGVAGQVAAQIVPATARRVDADNRRAQREARRTPTPYQESHLDIERTRLGRGDGDQPRPDGADALRYRRGAPVGARKKGLPGRDRKKKPAPAR